MATIQGIYVALFGRPADPTGLAFFNAATNNGANLNAIGDLAATKEYTDRFAGLNNNQIVSSIYKSLFNREPEAAGLNFFVDALNKGTLNIKNIAIAILDGAQGSDKTVVDVKIAAANAFTAQLDTPTEIAQYVGNDAAASARTWLAGITTTAPTATEVGAAIIALANGNTTIALTAGTDTVSLTSATATLKSTNNNDTIDAVTVANSLQSADTVDGGLGVDTLNASVASVVNPTVTSVEKFFITSTAAARGMDFSKTSGETEVWTKSSGATVALTNITKGTTLGVEGINTGVTFGFTASEVTGAADAATIALKGATATGLTLNSVETITFASSGTAFSVGGIAGDSLKDVKVTGDIGGSLTFAGASTTLKTVDVSAVNGSGVSVKVGGATTGVTVTGSKFAETITLSTEVLATDKDVVVYSKANVSTASQKDTIANFTTAEDKIDVKAFALTGGKAALTAFGAAPTDGASFLGNAVGKFGADYFVDIDNNGVFNSATDMVVSVTGGTAVIADFTFA